MATRWAAPALLNHQSKRASVSRPTLAALFCDAGNAYDSELPDGKLFYGAGYRHPVLFTDRTIARRHRRAAERQGNRPDRFCHLRQSWAGILMKRIVKRIFHFALAALLIVMIVLTSTIYGLKPQAARILLCVWYQSWPVMPIAACLLTASTVIYFRISPSIK